MKLKDKIANEVKKRDKKKHAVDLDAYTDVTILDCGMCASTYFNRNLKMKGGSGIGRLRGFVELKHFIENLLEGSFLCVEDSHFTPRNKKSRSQPFTEPQLYDIHRICEERGITLRLFPQKLTPRAITKCNSMGINATKGDEKDPISIYEFLMVSDISLKKPPTKFGYSPRQDEGHAMRCDINVDLNIARAYIDDNGRQKKYGDPSDLCSALIYEVLPLLLETLTEKELSIFVSKPDDLYYKRDCDGGKKGDVKLGSIKIAQLYTLASMFMRPDGELRTRPSTGCVAGFDFIESYLLVRSAWHYKGGVARSNSMYWGFRAWIRAQSKLLGNPLIDLSRQCDIVVGTKKDGTPKIETRVVTRGSFNEHEEAFFLDGRKFFQNTQDKVMRIFKKHLGLR